MTAGLLLTVASVPSAADTSGLKPETAQEQQDKQRRIDQQNLNERQRLQQPQSSREGNETPLYKENQPIGGQKQAGPADFPQPAFPWVKGELMQIEGEYYVIKDAEGKEIRVHVDKRTKMDGTFHVGDIVEVNRTLPGHALEVRQSSSPMKTPESSASSGTGKGSSERIVKDEQVTLSGAKQAVRGEVLKVEGENYVIKDGHGNEVRLAVNQNTRMFCGSQTTGSSLLPAPSASDKSGSQGQPQDLSRTNEQKGSEVGPGTKAAASDKQASSECKFKPGEMIEAEISDMGAATFIKQAGRAQPGQPLP
jgi:hypothetical protein